MKFSTIAEFLSNIQSNSNSMRDDDQDFKSSGKAKLRLFTLTENLNLSCVGGPKFWIFFSLIHFFDGIKDI